MPTVRWLTRAGCVLCAIALAATSWSAAAAPSDDPRSLAELNRRSHGKGDASRRRSLVRFAEDQRAPLPQRLRAVDQALRLDQAGSARLDEDRHLKARLLAVAGRWPSRARILRQQASDDRKQGRVERADRLGALVRGERSLPSLQRPLDRALQGKPQTLTAAGQRSVETARTLLPIYEELGLITEQTLVGCWIALLEVASSADEIWAALESCAQRSEGQRDLARARQASLRALARRAERAGDGAAALRWSLQADRVVVVAPARPAFDLPPPPLFGRSAESARLCHLTRQQGTSCAEVDRAIDGTVSFYDFSQDPVLTELDAATAAAVLSNHEVLLQDCLQDGVRTGELQRTRVELEWSVGLDGRVVHHELKPARLRQGDLPGCVAQAFGRFRYPRYRGEMQHVSLAFEVGE